MRARATTICPGRYLALSNSTRNATKEEAAAKEDETVANVKRSENSGKTAWDFRVYMLTPASGTEQEMICIYINGSDKRGKIATRTRFPNPRKVA